MKTIEEKAKRYDETIAHARLLLKTIGNATLGNLVLKNEFENMFPELKESEDERIRKSIIELLNEVHSTFKYYDINKMRAWLEKQGEQKPDEWHREDEQKGLNYPYVTGWRKNYKDNKPKVKHSVLMFTTHGVAEGEWLGEEWCQYRWSCKIKDEDVLYWLHISDLENLEKEGEQKNDDKVGPMFKVGDWVIKNNDIPINIDYSCCKVTKVENGNYTIESIYGYKGYNTFETFEKDYHLWTIQDAKDGDVLQLGEVTAIFKKYIGQGKCICYYSISRDGDFEIPIENGEDNIYGCTNTTPATKEQRDLLFQKMHEAGYEWDEIKSQLPLS